MTATEPQLQHDARCTTWKSNDPSLCDCRDEQGKTPASWADGTFIALDTETTGTSVTEDRIVTATVVVIRPGSEPQVQTWLADPGIEIPQGAADVHGISTERARAEGRQAADVILEVEQALLDVWSQDVPLCAYNASFDLSILHAELERHHGRGLRIAGPVVDPLVIDKTVDRYRKGSRKLVDVCAHYRVRIDNAHDATADALAAARVAWRIAQRYPAIGGADLAELHEQQSVWFDEQQRSFADYLRTKVAAKAKDDDERAEIIAKADDVMLGCGWWPLRGVA